MESQSPSQKTNPKPQDLSFLDAIKNIIDDRRISKRSWGVTDFFCEFKDGKLQLHKPDGGYYDWIITAGDIEGNDWFIL